MEKATYPWSNASPSALVVTEYTKHASQPSSFKLVRKLSQSMLVIKALYGLQSSGAVFRALLPKTLDMLGYKPSYADADVCLCLVVKTNGFEY